MAPFMYCDNQDFHTVLHHPRNIHSHNLISELFPDRTTIQLPFCLKSFVFFFFKQRREQQVGQESEEMPRGLHANFCGKTHSEVVKSLEKRLFIRHPQPSVIRNPLHPPGLLHSLSAQPFMEASHSSTTQQQYPDRFHRIPWQTDCMLKAIISFLFWGVSFCYLVIIIYYFTNKLKAATSWTELPFHLYSLSNRFIIIKNGVAATRISECLYDSIDFVDGEEPGHYPRQRTVTDLPSTTSAGSCLSAQRTQRYSWSKHWSSLPLGWTPGLCD